MGGNVGCRRISGEERVCHDDEDAIDDSRRTVRDAR